MIKVSDKVMYGSVKGVVTSMMGKACLVKLEDGLEYPVIVTDLEAIDVNSSKEYSVSELKNPVFLANLAKDMQAAGLSDLEIRDGKVVNFAATESLEEKKAKYREEAIKDAEKKAERDFAKENKGD